MAKAIFAAGCFWHPQKVFERIDGVVSTVVGYTGGETEHPGYEAVCDGHTGHAEAVEIAFDPARVSYDELLEAFWACHDPTTRNRQGPDVGTQYRSAVFVLDEEQRRAAVASRRARQQSRRDGREIVTEIVAAARFWPAEDYHQHYLRKGGPFGIRRLFGA